MASGQWPVPGRQAGRQAHKASPSGMPYTVYYVGEVFRFQWTEWLAVDVAVSWFKQMRGTRGAAAEQSGFCATGGPSHAIGRGLTRQISQEGGVAREGRRKPGGSWRLAAFIILG